MIVEYKKINEPAIFYLNYVILIKNWLDITKFTGGLSKSHEAEKKTKQKQFIRERHFSFLDSMIVYKLTIELH